MQYYPYNSRETLYRNKIGALAEGETLRLNVLLHRDAHVHNAYVCIENDSENKILEIELKPQNWLEDYRFYSSDISLKEGLYWYFFRYTSDYGEFLITKTENSMGTVSREGARWQQTVYCRNFKTPSWLKGGIIYQIFPDRFAKSCEIKANVPDDRYICDDWCKQPEYRQNNGKCSLGNDYYCGDFKGIMQKLDYLEQLGVTCIYLNPIFEAHSNHRYNTADYLRCDPLLGTEEELCKLIKSAEKKGIYIILDGVFSHTGDDSRYFNKKSRYNVKGAYNAIDSQYHSWYKFNKFPDDYSAWWGVPSLPETNENDPTFSKFITGENGVIRYWLKKGIKGWRLDVADELPDKFLDNVRKAVKSEGEDKYLLGEVWEDATNKISYGNRRRFLRGKQLDSVMNYPFANAIIDYVRGGNADELMETVMSIIENYPPQAINVLMNHIGTHDTARIITRLGSNDSYVGDRGWQANRVMSVDEYKKGITLLRIAAVLQYTLPGVPSLYYGDEAGLAGYGDPFCRGTYPWGKENRNLLDFYISLGEIRKKLKAFESGQFIPVCAELGNFAFIRKSEKSSVLIAVNRWYDPSGMAIPAEFANARVEAGNVKYVNNKLVVNGQDFVILSK